jgi:hypothetical protein
LRLADDHDELTPERALPAATTATGHAIAIAELAR